MSDGPKNYHNDGQEDRSDGKYDPPHSAEDYLMAELNPFVSREETIEMKEEDDSYNSGYNHTKEQEESSSSCFITTACVSAVGLPDDCEILSVLRNFRDTVLSQTQKGAELVRRYYEIAPSIVKSVNDGPMPQAVWVQVFGEIHDIKSLVDSKRYEEAVSAYEAMVMRLHEKHVGVRSSTHSNL